FAQRGATPDIDPLFIATWRSLLDDTTLTAAYKARVLSLPSQRELLEKTTPMDPLGVVRASHHLRTELGKALAEQWLASYHANTDTDTPYRPDPLSSGRRALKNLALAYLMAAGHPQAEPLAL